MNLQLTAKTASRQRDRRLPPGRWSRPEHPVSTAAITLYVLAGGVLYALAARAVQRAGLQ
jgi:hypothetical protein